MARVDQGTAGAPPPTSQYPATDRQLRYINLLAHEAGWDERELVSYCRDALGVDYHNLTRADAGVVIDALNG